MIHTSPLSSRNQFGTFLNGRGLTGIAAEIGTHRGDFARTLLRSWAGDRLYCVDPWSVPAGYESQAELLPEKGETRADDHRAAKEALEEFGARALLWKTTSETASRAVGDGALDFCYIDGDHSERAVSQDLRLWWPKVKPGGVLAGHDFVCPGPIDGPHNWGRGIQKAVLSFAESKGVDVYVIPEEETQPWSWILYKPR